MKKNIIISLLLLCSVGVAAAQTTLKTGYFMDRMATSHKLNPALSPEYGYFAVPVLGDINFGLKSNLSLDNFIFPLDNGTLGLFAHPDVDSSEFLDGLKNNNVISQDFSLSILSMGFHAFGGFNTFDISVRETFDINLKKDLFAFMVGDSGDSSSYNMSGSSIDLSAWAEVGFGHSRKINDNLTVGAKVKLLFGAADANISIDKLQFISNEERVMLDVQGSGSVGILGLPLEGSLEDLALDALDFSNGFNTGFGIDLGATYTMDKFTFSAALTDLGFIRWSGPSTMLLSSTLDFTGFEDLDINDFEGSTEDDLQIFEDFTNDLSNPTFESTDPYSTWLSAKLNLGAEYEVFEDMLSAGALWSTTFGPVTTTEFMLVGTYSPIKWFEIALSGTLSSYGSYWGWAMNFAPKWGFNFFIGSDAMFSRITPQGIPYSSSNFDLKFGLNIPLGR
ncbi:MAG: DUF5723 family protein [Rikenellaceae bacterium]